MSARSDPRLPSRTRSLAPDTQYGDIKLGKDDEKPLCVRASRWYPSRDRL